MTGKPRWLPEFFLAHLGERPPEIVYHYTTQAGLLGIIQDNNSELWATKVQYLNDSAEFNLSLRLAKERVLQLSANADERREHFYEAMLKLDGISTVNIFVACFCERGDLLSQWRGYSGRSHGFSVAMKTAELQTIAEPHGFQFGRCIYDRSKQISIIDEAIRYCINTASDSISAAALFEMLLLDVGAFFKDGGFEEEKEWRLVSRPILVPDKQVAFRAGTSMPIPFYKIPLGADLRPIIHGVIVGPCPHPDLSVSAVRLLLMQCGVKKMAAWGRGHEINVATSAIPFRDW